MRLSLAFVASLTLPFYALAGVVRDVATTDLTVHLSAPHTAQNADDFIVSATVVNTGSREVTLLKHGVMRQKLDNFAVVDAAGTHTKFTGIKVKYSPEHAAQRRTSSVVLAPGANVTVIHALASTYDLSTLSHTGSNALTLSTFGRTFYVVDKDTKAVTLVKANLANEQTAFEVAPDADLTVSKTKVDLTAREPQAGCNATQIAAITAAIPVAQAYLTAANTYMLALLAGTASSTLYVKWFGAVDPLREHRVGQVVGNMATNNLPAFTYNCGASAPGCDPDDYAYVDPTIFGVVNICSLFFTSPLAGDDSQGSTLVHEISHYNSNGGTDDIVYGVADSLALAQSSPAEAIMNACNYEYFSVDA